jgi:hypothetical protein
MSSNSAVVPSTGARKTPAQPRRNLPPRSGGHQGRQRCRRTSRQRSRSHQIRPIPCHIPQIQAVADCFISRPAAGDVILRRLHEGEPKSKNPRFFQAKRTSNEDPNTLAANKGRKIPKTRGQGQGWPECPMSRRDTGCLNEEGAFAGAIGGSRSCLDRSHLIP